MSLLHAARNRNMSRNEIIRCAFGRHVISSRDREELLKNQPEEKITECDRCEDTIRLLRDRNFVNKYSILEIGRQNVATVISPKV